MTARVVIDKPCATCGGTGDLLCSDLPEDTPAKFRDICRDVKCHICDGRGTVVTAVSRKTCAWWRNEDMAVRRCVNLNRYTLSDFGCSQWEPIRQNATTSDTSETTE